VNILHLLAPGEAGGLERVVHGLAIGQRARGHEVAVASVVHEPLRAHPFVLPLQRAGVTVHEVLVPHRAYWKERSTVASLCRALRPHVVHSHGYRTDVVDGGGIRKLGVATVATHHGTTRGSWRNRLYESLHWRALRQFDAVIAVSRVIASQLVASGSRPDRVHLVPNAWSEIAPPLARSAARAALNLPRDGIVVGWIGRMSWEKGIDVFIDAMAALSDSTIVACAIGEGRERSAEQARATRLVGSRIIWPGMIPEAGRFCLAFDLFVLSSRTEGVPIALLEAIATGTPIVATRVGGIPDIVSEREAWLVAPQQPLVLAQAIREAVANPSIARERASRANARLASELGRDAWLDRHDDVYAAAVAVRRAAT
jgi:glycosyltransferase involved in cell wall biosynthesis